MDFVFSGSGQRGPERPETGANSSRPPTKVCSWCGQEKPATLEYFNSRKKCRNGLDSRCRICSAMQAKQYRERVNYYQNNKEKINKKSNEWRLNNLERYKEYQKEWRMKRKED
jgi:hypothetical protein